MKTWTLRMGMVVLVSRKDHNNQNTFALLWILIDQVTACCKYNLKYFCKDATQQISQFCMKIMKSVLKGICTFEF